MDRVKIYYNTGKDEYFKKHNIQAQYYIKLDFESNEVSWYYYLPLPKGMHWKAGDLMGGLGADHHTHSQSFEGFLENPKLEMPIEEYNMAVKQIKDKLGIN